MNRIFAFSALAGLLLLRLIPPVSAAALVPADFQYCAEINGPFRKGVLYQVSIPAEVLERSAEGFIDTRILGPGNIEIPRVVIEDKFPEGTPETFPAEITGYAETASSSIITLKLPEKYHPISILDLDIPDRDFKKHVQISGSGDNKIWKSVGEADIYDFSSQVELRKAKLEFAPADYRYFRLTLIDEYPVQKKENAIRLRYQGLDFSVNGSQSKNIRIHSIKAQTAAAASLPSVYEERNFYSPVRIDKDGNSLMILQTDVPVDRIVLDISSPYYYRTVLLFGSNTGKDDSYQLLAREPIYRFPLSAGREEAKNEIEYRASKHAFYKIVIQNRNNPPVEIKSVTLSWVRKDLYFIALSDAERYSLCFGNPGLTPPDYDLEHFVTAATVRQQQYEPRSAGPARRNPDYVPGTPRDKRARIEKILLTSVVVLLVIGMGYWLYNLMRTTSKK